MPACPKGEEAIVLLNAKSLGKNFEIGCPLEIGSISTTGMEAGNFLGYLSAPSAFPRFG
jgi:hypothetical protein